MSLRSCHSTDFLVASKLRWRRCCSQIDFATLIFVRFIALNSIIKHRILSRFFCAFRFIQALYIRGNSDRFWLWCESLRVACMFIESYSVNANILEIAHIEKLNEAMMET